MPVYEHEMLNIVFIKNLCALPGDRDDKVKANRFLSHVELSWWGAGEKGNSWALTVPLGNCSEQNWSF